MKDIKEKMSPIKNCIKNERKVRTSPTKKLYSE